MKIVLNDITLSIRDEEYEHYVSQLIASMSSIDTNEIDFESELGVFKGGILKGVIPWLMQKATGLLKPILMEYIHSTMEIHTNVVEGELHPTDIILRGEESSG